jgi:hypothetical protein
VNFEDTFNSTGSGRVQWQTLVKTEWNFGKKCGEFLGQESNYLLRELEPPTQTHLHVQRRAQLTDLSKLNPSVSQLALGLLTRLPCLDRSCFIFLVMSPLTRMRLDIALSWMEDSVFWDRAPCIPLKGHIPEDSTLHKHGFENLEPCNVMNVFTDYLKLLSQLSDANSCQSSGSCHMHFIS